MSQEILYTSAPKGLKPGTKGFCTVMSTSNMARNLADNLESLCGYRHAFPPHTSNAQLNPINYSHLKIKVSGKYYHVLSRVADAGFDYSKRSNKLAHHVALDTNELVACGPAEVLAAPGFCLSSWDGIPKVTPAGRTPPNISISNKPCLQWKAATGDAGWAGVVAEKLLKSKSSVSIIFPVGMSTLPLVVEVMSLIPVENRWNITFSSYYTTLAAGFDCQLRFVLDGTAEAKALRQQSHTTHFDLAANLGAVLQNTSMVSFARTGQKPIAQKVSPARQMPTQSPTLSPIAQPQSSAHFNSNVQQPPDLPPVFDTTNSYSKYDHIFIEKKRRRTRYAVVLLASLIVLATGGFLITKFALNSTVVDDSSPIKLPPLVEKHESDNSSKKSNRHEVEGFISFLVNLHQNEKESTSDELVLCTEINFSILEIEIQSIFNSKDALGYKIPKLEFKEQNHWEIQYPSNEKIGELILKGQKLYIYPQDGSHNELKLLIFTKMILNPNHQNNEEYKEVVFLPFSKFKRFMDRSQTYIQNIYGFLRNGIALIIKEKADTNSQ